MKLNESKIVERAYSILQVKSVSDERRIIEGIASTPTPDRVEDIVEPLGARFRIPMPLLRAHDHDQPVGWVEFARPTRSGIPFTARIDCPEQDDPQPLKDRLNTAWKEVKRRLVTAVSIGFRALDIDFMETGGIRFNEWEWLELSLVVVPANPQATINDVKSLVRNLKGALPSNSERIARYKSAGASASTQKKGNRMKTIAERIAALEAARAQKAAAAAAIQEKADAAGVTKDASQKEEFDILMDDVERIDGEIKDLRRLETINVQKSAKTVSKVESSDDASAARSGNEGRRADTRTTVIGPNAEKGLAFARYVKCLFNAANNPTIAAMLAREHYPDDARIEKLLSMPTSFRQAAFQKAAVPAAYTGGAGWADVIASANVIGEFIELLRAQSIIDRFGQNGIPELRPGPFNVKVPRMVTGLTGHWTGEGLPAPVSKGVFDTVQMGKTKVTALTYMTREQLEFSAIDADTVIRDDLVRATAARQDATFVSADAAVADVRPAGLLNGLTPIATTAANADADQVRSDLVKLYAPFSAANISSSEIVLITTENLRNSTMLMKSALGEREFPGLTRNGGELEFYPVIASNLVGARNVIAIAPRYVMLAADNDIEVSVADQASIETLDSALVQTGVAGTGASLVSLWQIGAIGIMTRRKINWQKANTAAVAYINDATWGGAPSA